MDPDVTIPFAPVPPEKRRRARWLLPAELLLYAVLIGVAILGGSMNSGIHRMMAELGQALSWSLFTAAVGAAGLGLALAELFCGLDWPNRKIQMICQARMWTAAFGILSWVILAVTIFADADVTKAQFPLVLGPIFVFFHLWSIFSVLEVAVILDPTKDTRDHESRLQRNGLAPH